MKLTFDQLKTKLWGAADILRGQIDSADYKGFIISMLFLKRLSDRFDEEVEAAIRAGVEREIAENDKDEHEFFVPQQCRWRALTSAQMGLGEVLNAAADAIEAANAPRLDGILRATNWNDDTKLGSPANRDRIIRTLLLHFTDLDLRDASLEQTNVLGDAYEYLIEKFADDAGKKGGEFYTPRKVVSLLVQLLNPQEGMWIGDPTAGSAGMLIYAAEHVRDQGGNPVNLVLHGQERNLSTLGIGKLNLLLHGLNSARMEGGDTIAEPRLLDDRGSLLAYHRTIANPPFSLKVWGYDLAPHDPHHRFDRYGAYPPRTKGDLAFLLHMIATTRADGMVGVVMPHGVLFRGGAEGEIRRGIVKDDLFESIIGLAPNLFNGASIPVAICVLNKAKPLERKGKVLFVDAAQEGYFRPGKARNYLDDGHLEKIVAAYTEYREQPGFAHVADLAEIDANDFNLNISRYVEPAIEQKQINVKAELARLRELERERDAAVSRMNGLLMELGYATGKEG